MQTCTLIAGEIAKTKWCYDYKYDGTPEFAGSGYKPGAEDFSGSVTAVVMHAESKPQPILLFKGDTMGTGAKLQQTTPLELWNENYKLQLEFTMPEDLGEIDEWDGLLGSEKGGHPYPYFNSDGFYYEKQNGPHPKKAVFGLHLFKARKSYVITINHYKDKHEGNCFAMFLEYMLPDGKRHPSFWHKN